MVARASSGPTGRWVGYLLLALGLVLAPLAPLAPVHAAPGDPGTISGVVLGTDGLPLSGAMVTLYDDGQAPTGTPQVTGADGLFEFGGLNGLYYVGATKNGVGTVFYNEAATLDEAWSLFADEFSAEQGLELRMPAPPQITGTVSNASGAVQFADVTAYELVDGFWDWAGSASTDAVGRYEFTALDSQGYKLEFSATDQVTEYWNDKPDLDSADTVNVVVGETRTADAVLADPLSIAGTVTGAGGTPLQGATVTAEKQVTEFGDTFWDYVDSDTTGAGGTYRLDVPPGQMRISFQATTYVSEYYNDALDEADADLVTVTDTPVTGVDAALQVGGTVSGTVRDNVAAAVANVEVTAYRLVGGAWTPQTSATTSAAGAYTLDGLRAGTYRVGFLDYSGDFLEEYYLDKDTLEAATDVPVTHGGTATVNATLDRGGVVGGTISGPAGAVVGASVVIYQADSSAQSGWDWFDSATTQTGGTYSFVGLLPGSYRLCVDRATGLAPECYNDKSEVFTADSVTAAKNVTTTANMTLAAARKITGTLTSRAGGALANAGVSVQRKLNGPEGAFWQSVSTATATTAGAYSVDVAPGTYRVQAFADEHRSTWYGDALLSSRSTRIDVSTSADQTGKNITLDRFGRISGVLTGPSGPVVGGTVRIHRWSFGDFSQVRQVTSGAGGAYAVTGLTPGNYRVGFSAAGMTPEFNLDKTDVELADDVVVDLNATATVNAALVSNQRTLSGTVTAAPGGAAVSGVTVRVERRVQTQDDVRWRVMESPSTASDGTWSASVPDGTYRLGFRKSGYIEQWYNDATVVADATPVVVAGSNRPGLSAVLQVGGKISGTVTGPTGPLSDGYVTFYREASPGDLRYEDDVPLGAAGAYTSPPLTPGSYVVEFEADGHVSEYFDNKADESTAQRIIVGIGTTATADATLAAALQLSGAVTGPTDAPLADADITVERWYDFGGYSFWDYEDQTSTAADGLWSVEVRPGTYRISFDKSSYVTQWWNNAATAAAAQSVVVSSAGITGLSAKLALAPVLKGTVTGPDGPVRYGDVNVYPGSATDLSTAPVLASASTDEVGQYVIDSLPAGSYKIRFEGDRLLPEFHLDAPDLASATAVAISTVAPTTVNATLARGKSIAGTLTGVGGPIEDGEVAFYARQPDGSFDYVDSDDTDADGAYRAFLPSGTYRLHFSGYDNRLSEWYDNVTVATSATPVVLDTSDVTGRNAVLDDGATVTGTVTFPQRKSGWDSVVRIYDAVSGELADSASVSAHVNAFSVDDLAPGTYRADFARSFGYDVAEAQFYNGQAENQSVSSSQTFTLAAAGTRSGVSAVLVEGGRLTGRVRDTSSNPVTGCVVTAYSGDGTRVGRESRPSAADGTYAVPGLTTGNYLLRVVGGGCGGTTAYYDGAGTVAPSADSAVPVGATRGTSTAVPQDLVIGPPDAPPMVNNSVPTISDSTPTVGQTLTATSGGWTPSDGTYAYQWLADGTAITGATASSYTVLAGDVGKTLSVRVTASKVGFTNASATSAATSAVPAPPTMTNTALPAVSDTTPTVGQALTATSGTWAPADGTYAYQWLADGTPIGGATSSGYTAAAGDLNKTLSVRVTASKTGYTSGTATSATTSAVAAQPVITSTAPPTVSDTTPEVGQVLTAGDGTWSEPGVTFAYQWLSGATVIAGATGKTYQVPGDQVGQQLSVRVTASKSGYTSGTATSASTSPVATASTPFISNTAPPTIDDTTPTVDQTLTATNGTWSEPGVTFAYRWFADNVVVPGAIAQTYVVPEAQVGRKLSVEVTAAKTGFTSGVGSSAQTSAVAPRPTMANSTLPVISDTTPTVGQALTATSGTWSPADGTYSYQWLANGTPIAGATTNGYAPTTEDEGRTLSVRVTASKVGHTSASATSAITSPVVGAPPPPPVQTTISCPTPKVTGTFKVGKKVKAVVGTITPSGVTVKYQWLRNGKKIQRATKSIYKLVAKDQGKKIAVRVTYAKAGSPTVVKTSAAKKVK